MFLKSGAIQVQFTSVDRDQKFGLDQWWAPSIGSPRNQLYEIWLRYPVRSISLRLPPPNSLQKRRYLYHLIVHMVVII
jgi:hypothetical protein